MPSITVKEYTAERGSRFSNTDAQKIGPEIVALSENGDVTPRDVVDAARSSNSALHSYFEWNDKKAADLHRVEQARNMLRSINIKYIENGQPKEARAFQVVSKGAYEDAPRKYSAFHVLSGDIAFSASMMDNAITDIMAWKKRYQPYTEMWIKFGDIFQGVVNQISEFEEAAKVETPAEKTDQALAKLYGWRDEFAAVLQLWTSCREQVGFIMDAIGEAETTFGRLDQRRDRQCMQCKHDFKSMSFADRICPACEAKREAAE